MQQEMQRHCEDEATDAVPGLDESLGKSHCKAMAFGKKAGSMMEKRNIEYSIPYKLF